MSARDEILNRIRAATASAAPTRPVAWEYGLTRRTDDVIDLFCERVADYRAEVVRCAEADLAAEVAAALTRHQAETAVIPAGLPEAWLAEAQVTLCTDAGATAAELDTMDAVVTAAAVGVAETGTLVLDHRADQGRRALSLVPDLHLCVIRAEQVVDDVPAAIARLAGSLREGLPLTWISGPSATSDIELSRVEGVHGPRTLVVILAE